MTALHNMIQRVVRSTVHSAWHRYVYDMDSMVFLSRVSINGGIPSVSCYAIMVTEGMIGDYLTTLAVKSKRSDTRLTRWIGCESSAIHTPTFAIVPVLDHSVTFPWDSVTYSEIANLTFKDLVWIL